MTAYSHNSSNYKNKMELQILNLKDRYCLFVLFLKNSSMSFTLLLFIQ